MHTNIFAYTAPGSDYPPYVSINKQDDGRIVLSARGPGGSPNDHTVQVELPADELARLAASLSAAAVRKETTMNITINGRPHSVQGQSLSHEDICALAGQPDFASVTYSGPRKGDLQRSGMTRRGKSVTVEDGMHFNCVVTGNA